MSELSVRGYCNVCAQPICNDCWDSEGIHSCQEHRAQRESEIATPSPLFPPSVSKTRIQCGLCHRGISDEQLIGGYCEREGCEMPLCLTCWQEAYRTCSKHLLINEQKLE